MLRSIRVRILAAFVLSLAASAGALGYGLVQLRAIGQGLIALDAGYLPLAEVAAEIEAIARQMDREHDRFAREAPRPVAGRRSNAAFYSSSLSDAIGRGREVVEHAAGRLDDLEERDALGAISSALQELDAGRSAYDEAMDSWLDEVGNVEPRKAEPGDPDLRAGAESRGLAELDKRRTDLVLSAGSLGALIEGRIQAVSQRTTQSQSRAYLVSGALSALAILLAGGMATLALVTLRPIGLLTAEVQRLAAGEHGARVAVTSRDEVGVLAREFNAMADAVAERDRRLSERAAALDALSARLRQVIDTIHAGLVVVEEGRVAMANPAAARLWAAQEGAPLPQLLAPLPHGRHEALISEDQTFDLEIAPFGAFGTLIVGEDISQRLRDAERLARTERLALVGQMLAQITHEVRNPLNAMSLNAEVLTEEIEDPELRDMLGTIVAEIGRLEAVTARYLDLSRRRQPEPTEEDPVATVRSVVHLEEEALRRAGLEVEVAGEPGRVVEIDGDALRRALRNLIRNASEAGATHVRVHVSWEEGRVRVIVADDGPGIEPDTAAHAFEPFFTTKSRGTGLGLAISRQELEETGGSLRCHSAPGEGTTFTLTVPYRASEGEDDI